MDSIASQLAQYGVPLVGLNVLLQQLGLPIPAVPTMMLAGALAVAGRIDFAAAFAISVVASLVADLAWFWAGRRYGYPVLRFLCRISLSPDTCVRQTEGIFERWGFFSVVISKFVPGFSTVAPPIAGALKMRTAAFVAASFASAALWVGAAMVVGAVFARQIEFVLGWIEAHVVVAAFVIGAIVGAYIVLKAFQRWRMTRFVAAAMISVDELRARLADTPRHRCRLGPRAPRATAHPRRRAAGSRCDRARERFSRGSGDRRLLRVPQRGIVASRGATPARKRLSTRAAARWRH